ncbi:MAG: hypothetical protein PHU53_00940 [Thermoplasmata archaeon]|nr:hypothetical protein [Thermoplasmata archaeon]
MGLWDKTKDLGNKTVDAGKTVGHGAVDLGKKGYHKTEDALEKKTCGDCKHFKPKDAEQGDCPIAGMRMASAAASTCPQKAFEAK